MLKKLPHLLNAALGLALTLTPFCLFPVCGGTQPDGSPMSCWYSGVLIAGLGAVALILSLLGMWIRVLSIPSWIASSFAALLCWLIPNGIVRVDLFAFGLCGDAEHACRAVTMPAVGAFAVAVVLVSVVGLILNFVGGNVPRGEGKP